ncbi:MAG: LURP-one-related family protein [Clostridia bacterium]|nr:LURP-one-related family protein [Clostridia bacterium]
MKYIIKNKIMSIGAGSTVRDEAGNDLFFVKGKVFTFTKKKFLRTMNKEVLYTIQNKFLYFFLPKVFIKDADGNNILMIKKKSFFSFKQNFEIIPAEGKEDLNVEIQGDIIGWNYDILENGIAVAHIRRNFNLIKDSFTLETDMEDKAAFYIAFVIALDNYFDALSQDYR